MVDLEGNVIEENNKVGEIVATSYDNYAMPLIRYKTGDFTSYSNYQNKTLLERNVYEIANATLSYKKENSVWFYKIKAQNLLNAQFKQSNRFSDYLISDTKTYLLPRVIMFSIGYNL